MNMEVDKKMLGETIRSTIPNSPDGTKSIEFPESHQQEQAQKQQPEPSDSLRIDINDNIEETSEMEAKSPESKWVKSIRQKLDRAHPDKSASSWATHCIYRIPHYRIKGDETAYFPQIVSLGPYHHGKKHLRQMEHHKWRALSCLLNRNHQDITLYLNSIRKLEAKARCCYEGTISLSSDKFVEMMVLDGCFMLELFMGNDDGFGKLGYSRNDPIFTDRGPMCNNFQRDMIMLENQLPLFILECLLGLYQSNNDQKGDVATLAIGFLEPLIPTDEPSDGSELESSLGHKATSDPSADQVGLHCLDVVRKSLLRAGPKPVEQCPQNKSCLQMISCVKGEPEPVEQCPQNKSCLQMISCVKDEQCPQNKSCLQMIGCVKDEQCPQNKSCLQMISCVKDEQCPQNKSCPRMISCVKELREAGVKFKKRKTDRFWDVKFENGVLSMPPLLIDGATKSLFLNLIAFEQKHLDCGNDITGYVILMDYLINSPEDVAYLHYDGIIDHVLGSDAEVADLFNSLCQRVVFDLNDGYLSRLSEAINNYCGHKCNTWRASLKHKYFSNPWTIISLVAAVVLLLLTLAQTFYSVYGYYRPAS